MAWAQAGDPIRPEIAVDVPATRRMAGAVARAGRKIPGSGLFVIGALSQYGGAAIAVTLFPIIGAPSVAWARLAASAAVLALWRRPWRLRWPLRQWGLAIGFGLALAAMNVSFYLALDRLPMGTAVAIEFTGPVAVAALGTRRWRDGGALALAVGGVLLLADVSWGGSPLGVLFALGAAVLWAGYILLGSRVAAGGAGVDGLTVGLIAGAVALAPFLAAGVLPAVGDGWLLVACVGVGLLSTAVPYAIDQVVLVRVSASRFALLQALLPATAAVVGVVFLRQIPSLPEAVGVALVILAVAVNATGRR
ncbi:EamA family transporter [Fodinicola acaciae]|uniref:EamA family transporter n=1 Tax=Fodinicola acaciae TaxID=2681555 RepID=UPI001FE3DD31|nr:EamA family transporter [Fodinicola acaciae]